MNASSERSGPRDRKPSHYQSTGRLAVLTFAMLLGAIGFAVPFLWIGALVLMGIVWGAMIAERQQRRGTEKGLVADLVTTVVDEAKEVKDSASG